MDERVFLLEEKNVICSICCQEEAELRTDCV